METKQKEKLGRYLRNSSRFLWGFGKGLRQAATYAWLKEEYGYEFDSKKSYSFVTKQLVDSKEVGIERLINEVIIPHVKKRYGDDVLKSLHRYWHECVLPDYSFVIVNYLKGNAYPFLEINNQYEYVERWGEFAGIWFEEIEPHFEI